MRTILDVDYQDLCLSGNGDLASLDRLFREAKTARFDSILWAPMVCGKALYPSNVVTRLQDTRMHKGGHNLRQILGQFDPLEEATKLAANYEMELLFYYRLFDDYFPGLEEDFFESRPDLYWQSRCGNFAFKGWPCYHQSEASAHKMRLFQELQSYGPDGFMVEVGRSHSYFATSQRAINFFGYDEPVANEYMKRYGLDIRAFEYMEPIVNNEGRYAELPFAYSMEYTNPTQFDVEAWHWLKGEGVETFLRELRAQSIGQNLLMQGGICPPHPVAAQDGCAKFYIDANQLAQDEVIDGYSYSANFTSYSTDEIEGFFFPHFSGIRESGKPVGAWLNDILTADGGNGTLAEVAVIERYIETVLQTSLDYVVIHEADFLIGHPQHEQVWKAMQRFKSLVAA